MELYSMLRGSLDGGGLREEWIQVYVWLFIWNYHNIVNRLYPEYKIKSLKFGEKKRKEKIL